MKVSAEPIVAPAAFDRANVSIWLELTKARLTTLVLATTLVGFYLGSGREFQFGLLAWTMAGTGLLACGAAALNQWIERDYDARMLRTAHRPLPSGRIQPDTVLIFGALTSAVGLMMLALAVNLLAAVLGAITLASYLFIYTPLKRITTLNTVVGAVPGALPPLLGWVAARGEVTIEGWALFAILFFWQLPHFLAIAWLYRDDYARGGFVMLPVVDRDGMRTGLQSVSHTLGLLSVSLFPVAFGLVSRVYLAGAIILGLAFLASAVKFARGLSTEDARRMFFVSIIYLPVLLGLMMISKIPHG